MITVNTFISLFGNLAPVFMTLLLLAGVGLLLKSAFSQDALISQQRDSLKELRSYVVQTVKSQVELTDQIDALRERCARLVAHQQLAKPSSSDHRRFDLAVRMLKRGVGDMKTLHDLGLSDSEADLLWRLHGSHSPGEVQDLQDSAEAPESAANTVNDVRAESLDETIIAAPTAAKSELSDELGLAATETETLSEEIIDETAIEVGASIDDELPELTISLDVLPMDAETMGDDSVELSEEGASASSDDDADENDGRTARSGKNAKEDCEPEVLMCESVAPHGASQAQALTEVLRLR